MSNPTQNSSIEYPAWFDGKRINEGIFCTEFLRDYPMLSVNGTFFTVNGRVRDENRLKKVIYDRIKQYITSGVAKKVTNLLDVMRMECCTAKLSLYQDRIHVANVTYFLDGTFTTDKDFCRNRLPVAYNPDAPQPEKWLLFCLSFWCRRISQPCRNSWAIASCPPPRGRRCFCSPAGAARAKAASVWC